LDLWEWAVTPLSCAPVLVDLPLLYGHELNERCRLNAIEVGSYLMICIGIWGVAGEDGKRGVGDMHTCQFTISVDINTLLAVIDLNYVD